MIDTDTLTVHVNYDSVSRKLSFASDQDRIAGTEGDKAATKVTVTMIGQYPSGRSYVMMFDVRALNNHRVTTRQTELTYSSETGTYDGWIPSDVFNNTLYHKLPVQLKVQWTDANEVEHRYYSLNVLTFKVLERI